MTNPTSATSPDAVSLRSLFKNVAQSSAVFSLPFILQRLAGVFMIPITTRFLTPSDYGIVELLDQALTVMALLLGIRFASALGYFYFKAEAPQDRSAVASTTILGAFVVGLIAVAVFWPISAQLSQLVFGSTSAEHFFHLALLGWPIGFSLEAIFGLLRVENRSGMYTAGSVCRLVLSIAANLVLVALLRMHVAGVIYAALIAGGLTECLLLVDVFRRMRPSFNLQLFIRMAKYAMPLGVGGIATFIINFGDRFFLSHSRPLEDLGVYVLAYKVGMMMSFVYGSFDSYWSAQVFNIMQRTDSNRVFARMFTYVVLGLSLAALGLIVSVRPILSVMAGPAFQGATALVPVIVLAYYIRAIGDYLRSLFMVAGRTGYDAITNWVGAAVCLASYWFLIPRFGAWGAAFATVLAFFIITVISAVWTYRVRAYQVEAGRLAKMAVALTVAFLPWSLIPASSLVGQIGVAAASLALFPAGLWLLGFATPGELQNGRIAFERLYEVSRRIATRS